MHFLMVLIVIVIGIFGVISFLKDSSGLIGSLKESAGIAKKVKEEKSAFMQFCEEQKVRDKSRKVSKATTRTAPASSGSAPLSVPASSRSRSSFGNSPFGNVDFRHLGNPVSLSDAAPAPRTAAASKTKASDNNNASSPAQQAKSSDNPIIKTWGGYVSQIEDAAK